MPNLHLIFKEWLTLKTNCHQSIYSIYYPVIKNFLKYKEYIYTTLDYCDYATALTCFHCQNKEQCIAKNKYYQYDGE